jgi:hypothetical protein
MEKVEVLSAKAVAPLADDLWATNAIAATIQNVANELNATVLDPKPECRHGARVWREGTSAKTGKAWANYSCVEKSKASQCEPLWYVFTSSGDWKPQV